MRALLAFLAVMLGGAETLSDGPQPAPQVPLTGVVTGTVQNASGQPLESARVAITALNIGARTNSGGRFLLINVPAGSHEVTVELLGYERHTQTVTVTDQATTNLEVRMTAVAIALDALTVTTAGQGLERARVDRGAGAPAPYGLVRAEEARRSASMLVAAAQMPSGEPYNREAYEAIEENAFHSVRSQPLSTFSIDVDRASYANVRRFIRGGALPPKDAVRIEELINYFTYDYPEPSSTHPFSIVAEAGPAPWRPEHQLVRVGIQAQGIDVEDIPPSNLVFLLDVSGSMSSANKLPLLKSSLRLLVDQLRPSDRVAIVVYAGAAGVVLGSTPGSEKGTILEALDRLQAGGSTAGGAGLRLAYDVARSNFIAGGNNRVILATDGDFNVGESSDGAMVELIEEKREEGTFLTVLGFGTGNLQDAKMEKLADHGNGNFAYIDNLLEAKKVLVTEMGGTLYTIAKDVKIQVEFNPARIQAYRLIGYENRLLATEDFDDDEKDAGELGAGHSVTALYEVVPAGVESGVEIREAPELRYQDRPERSLTTTQADGELMFVKLRYKEPDGEVSKLIERPVKHVPGTLSEDFRFASSVAWFGMLLRQSPHAGDTTFDDVLELARTSRGQDVGGYRAEFVKLAEAAMSLRTSEDRQQVR